MTNDELKYLVLLETLNHFEFTELYEFHLMSGNHAEQRKIERLVMNTTWYAMRLMVLSITTGLRALGLDDGMRDRMDNG